jgi:hypothetical protein
MLGKRKWRLICVLVISPVVTLLLTIGMAVQAHQDKRRTFDDLREGMTVEEASEVLGKNLRSAHMTAIITGTCITVYDFDTSGPVLPGDKILLVFYDGELRGKNCQHLSLQEFCSELLDRGKRYLRI